VGKFTVPYETVIHSLDGEFYEGFGFSFEGSTAFVCHVLKAWEASPPKPPEKRKYFRPALDPYGMNMMRERHFEAVFGRV
jgi:hypothetical protein